MRRVGGRRNRRDRLQAWVEGAGVGEAGAAARFPVGAPQAPPGALVRRLRGGFRATRTRNRPKGPTHRKAPMSTGMIIALIVIVAAVVVVAAALTLRAWGAYG